MFTLIERRRSRADPKFKYRTIKGVTKYFNILHSVIIIILCIKYSQDLKVSQEHKNMVNYHLNRIEVYNIILQSQAI